MMKNFERYQSTARCKYRKCERLAQWLVLLACDDDSFTGIVACSNHATFYMDRAMREHELGRGRPQPPVIIELS
jgi:hypothetical protein